MINSGSIGHSSIGKGTRYSCVHWPFRLHSPKCQTKFNRHGSCCSRLTLAMTCKTRTLPITPIGIPNRAPLTRTYFHLFYSPTHLTILFPPPSTFHNVNSIRNNFPITLPPRHNRQLRVQRTHRQKPNQHTNLGAPRKHIEMGIVLQKLLSNHAPIVR
jgi:hypothetical protein